MRFRYALPAVFALASACTPDAADPIAPLETAGAGRPSLAALPTPSNIVYNPATKHYYGYVTVPGGINYLDAKREAMNTPSPICKSGYLAVITNKEENLFIRTKLTPVARPTAGFVSTYGYWLGAQRVASKWSWISGELWKYYPKAPVKQTTQTAVRFYSRKPGQTYQGYWAPTFASYKMPGYVIEWQECAPDAAPIGYDPEEDGALPEGPPEVPGDTIEVPEDGAPEEPIEEEEPVEEPAPVAVDSTAPVITATVQGTTGKDGWYTSDVSLSWTVADAESEITDRAGCVATQVTEDTQGVTFVCTATSEGGTSRESVTLKRDATRPGVSGSPAGTLAASGWYTSDVEIRWHTEDGVSGVASTEGCVTSGTRDGRDLTVTCTAVNGAGLTGSATLTYKRDGSAPVVDGALEGTLGANGWYTSDVTIRWEAADDVSGIASTEGCAAATASKDTAGATLSCDAVNGAGLAARKSLTYKRDTTAPVVKGTLAGTQGANGWYTSDVSVAWSTEDDLSGVADTEGCVGKGTTDTESGTLSCRAVNGAGLPKSESVTFKRDASAPAVRALVEGTQGANGWYTSDVTVRWETEDDVSGVASTTGCATVAGVKDTAGATLACAATNGAGLSASKSVTYKRDTTAPVVKGTLSGTLGSNGWYRSDVSVTWSTTDDLSGVADTEGCIGRATVDTESGTLSCRAVNGAGLPKSESVTFKRDATAPVVAFAGALPVYLADETVAITCTATDNLSGIAQNGCVNVAGEAASYNVGVNTVTAWATDRAGNRGTGTVSFTVKVSFASVANVASRCITNKGISNSLRAKLDAAEKQTQPQARQNLLKALRNEVTAQRGKQIPTACADTILKLTAAL